MPGRLLSLSRAGHLRRRPAVTAVAVAMLTAATTASAVVTAAPASAALPPDLAALVAAPPPVTALHEQYNWTVTVAADGPLAEHPGNRHQAEVEIKVRDGEILGVEVMYADENCDDAGVCRGVGLGAGGAAVRVPFSGVAADGSVHLVVDIPPGSLTGGFGVPAPVTGGRVDLRLTMADWQDPGGKTLNTAQIVQHTWDPNARIVSAESRTTGQQITATGSVVGIPVQRVVSGEWRAARHLYGTSDEGTPPVTTLAEARRWLPPVSQGRLLNETSVSPGNLSQVRGPLVTSTGYRFPGNTYRTWPTALIVKAGAPAGGAADTRPYILGASLVARQCAAGQAWEQCTPVTTPRLDTVSRIDYDFRQPLRFRGRTVQPVTETAPDDSTRALGTMAHTVDVTGAGTGRASITLHLFQADGRWSQKTELWYAQARGTATLAGRTMSPPSGETANLRITHESEGAL